MKQKMSFVPQNFEPKKEKKGKSIIKISFHSAQFLKYTQFSATTAADGVNEKENDCSRLSVMVLEVETILSIRHIIFALTLA